MPVGPQNAFSAQLHAEKYREPNESFREGMGRVAGALKDSDDHYHEFRDILLDMRFMPAGRVQAAMGASRRVTPYNCFVSGTIGDSFVDGAGSIMNRASQAATTMRMGGGIGYDFSTLRPRGALIKKLGSASSGPLGFMPIFNEICRATSSAGNRRGAQMGVMRIDHPDVGEFIRAKQPSSDVQVLWDIVENMPAGPQRVQAVTALQHTLELTGFNLSVALTDDFMEAVDKGSTYKLKFGSKIVGEADAQATWEALMRSTWDWAEPGALFIDTINRMNPLYYCEKIAATNPCGEQPLPPFGACLLGSFNLVKYLIKADDQSWAFDYDTFVNDIPGVVRAMDNVVDRASFPLHEQEEEAKNKRRMGLGITALANALETLGFPYGEKDFIGVEDKVLDTLRDEAYRASAYLAKEKGPFPLYDAEKYCAGPFFQTLAPDVQDLIRKYGLRNSHLLSIAPTGTISLSADNVSSSIEPVFSVESKRTVNMADGQVVVDVLDYAYDQFGTKPKAASDVTIDEHLAVLLSASKRVDSAVSKTCNVPANIAWDDFKSVYTRAWEGGAKGCTTFNIGGKRMGIMVAKAPVEDAGGSCQIDLSTGRRSCE